MTLVALVCIAATASAQSVYVSTGDGAVAYHKSKSCSYLTNSKDVKSVSTAEAKKMGRHECTRCYGTAAAAKKATTTAKKATTQARDEKGRFIKKAETEAKTVEKKAKKDVKAVEKKAKKDVKTVEKKAKKDVKAVEKKIDTKKKATPARDEKGRFIKKAA